MPGLEWIVTFFVLIFTGFTWKLLLRFNAWWYEPKLQVGQAPLPPGSLGWPVFGNMPAFLRAFKSDNPDSFINHYISRYNRVGLYSAFLFWQPTILATTPETCKLVLTKDSLFETGWPVSTRKLIGLKSFAGLTGKEHLRLRRLTEPAFKNPRSLQQHVPFILHNISHCLENWSKQESVLLLKELRKFSFLTIHNIIFSNDSGMDVEEMASLYYIFNQGIRAIPVDLPGTAFNRAMKARNKLAALVQKVIHARRVSKDAKSDTLALLMNEPDEDGNLLEDEQIIDMLIMYLNAGHDSTAHLILWLIIMIHRHPAVYSKVKAEQQEILAGKPVGEPLVLGDMKKMSYLSSVIDETLRVTNISPMVFRKATSDVQFNGFTIPKGWHVEAWLRQVHMDPHVHSNPETFDPDRYSKYDNLPFTLVPFGMGVRTCPGSELARIEASIVVHRLVTTYSLEALNPACKVMFLPHPKPADFYPVRITKTI